MLILQYMRPEGRLMGTYLNGETGQPAFLDDYAHLTRGLLELYRTTGHPRWLSEAEKLAGTVLAEFEDKQDGGFFFTTEDHENVLGRSKRLQGSGNVPTANGVAAEVLLELGRVTEKPRYTEAAVRTLESLSNVMGSSPRAVEALVYVAAMHVDPIADEAKQTPSVADSSENTKPDGAADLPEPDTIHENAPVTARAYASRNTVKPGESFEVAVALDIGEGWHLYGPNPEIEFVLPTTVSLAEGAGFEAGEAEIPEGRTKQDPVLDEELRAYEGRVWFRLPVTVPEDAEPGETTLTLDLRTQACDARRCLPPREAELSVPVTIDPEAEADGEPRHPEVFTERAGPGQ